MSGYDHYTALTVDIDGGVANVSLAGFGHDDDHDGGGGDREQGSIFLELGRLMNEFREDRDVRVIVLTGARDGVFLASGPSSIYAVPEAVAHVTDPVNSWHLMGVIRTHTAMAEIEKPIVAKVNGDAIGFGQSVMFSSDFAIAREDAVINDVHMGQGTVLRSDGSGPVGPGFGLVPGDGAGAVVPLFMSPMKAKEYLMLSETLTGAELAAMNCINAAVPAAELDARVDELVEKLLSKSAYALGWTKRLVNRHVFEQLNRALDLSLAYEHITIMQSEKLGFDNLTTL